MFTCTEEALKYGKTMTEEKAKEIRKRIFLYHTFSDIAITHGDSQLAMEMATRAQLCREACEARNNASVVSQIIPKRRLL